MLEGARINCGAKALSALFLILTMFPAKAQFRYFTNATGVTLGSYTGTVAVV